MYNEKTAIVRAFHGAIHEFIYVICTIRNKFGIFNGNASTLAKIIHYGIYRCISDGFYIFTCKQWAYKYVAEVKDVIIMDSFLLKG